MAGLQDANTKLQEQWVAKLTGTWGEKGESNPKLAMGEPNRHLRDAEKEISALKANVISLRMQVRKENPQAGNTRPSSEGDGKEGEIDGEAGHEDKNEEMEIITVEQIRKGKFVER